MAIKKNHAETPTDLPKGIDGTPNTVVMPGPECCPDDPVWTNFGNFWQIWGYFSTGKR